MTPSESSGTPDQSPEDRNNVERLHAAGWYPHTSGKLVAYSDYEALREQVARLTRERDEARAEVARIAPQPTPHDHLSGVCYRHGDPTLADHDEAIADLTRAREALAAGDHFGCVVCGDSGHSALSCHHNPLLLARQWAAAQRIFQCYHCGFIATTDEDARAHFGINEDAEPACFIARAEAAEKREAALRVERDEALALVEAMREALQTTKSALQMLIDPKNQSIGAVGVMGAYKTCVAAETEARRVLSITPSAALADLTDGRAALKNSETAG